MPDPIQSPIIIGTPGQLPLEEALQPLEKKAFINLGDDATSVQRTWAGFSGDPKRLDLGDVFYALAHSQIFGNLPEIKAKLMDLLGYRPQDPVTFKTLALTPIQQLALSIIEPEAMDRQAPTLVFVAGFAHPASLYVPHLAILARELRSRVVIMDLPGNGGSQCSTTVDAADYHRALIAAITSEVPVGEKFFIGAHSLGSAPAYRLFQEIARGERPVGNRELVRMVVINPIPSRLHETSGAGTLSRGFMGGAVGSEIAHGLAGLTTNSLSRFDNDLPDKVDGRATMMQQDNPITPFGMMDIFGTMDGMDMNAAGQDERLTIVISGNDRLMNWDATQFTRRRGYFIIRGDHGACLTGRRVNSLCTSTMAIAFTVPANPYEPLLTSGEVYRRPTGMLRVGLQGGSLTPVLAVAPEIAVKHGIASFGSSAGIYAGASILAELGREFGRSAHWMATPLAQMAVGLETLHLPLDLKVGAQGGVDYLHGNGQPLVASWITSLGVNLVRIVDIEVQARLTIGGAFQDVITAIKIRLN